MANNSMKKVVVGVCQMTCTGDKHSNFQTAKSLVEQCKHRGAEVNRLPCYQETVKCMDIIYI